MSTITTRAGKGSELTWAELDANFTALNTDKLQPDFNGNVGIGTSSPSTRLDIQGTTAIQPHLRLKAATGSTGGFNRARIGLYNNAASNTGWDITELGDGSDALAFDSVVSGTATERMRLDSSGNLGIGTTSPSSKLSVVGTGVSIAKITDSSATGYSGLTFSGTGTQNYSIGMGGPSETGFTVANKFYVYDGLAGAMRLVLDSSGNLGLGVTPSAWSGYKAIDVTGNGVVSGSTSATLAQNAYFNGVNWVYKNTAIASYYQVSGNGSHVWSTAPSGTAGNAITFTQAMTLDASGGLLLGQTTAGYANANSISFSGGTGYGIFNHLNGTASGAVYAAFAYNAVAIGSITQSGTTAVFYNTASDQRLKENIQDAAPASALIDAIQVRSFDWKADGSHQRYGMVAQELYQVAPEAVHASADPDDMMAVDYSKLVPMLVKEIQSLRKRLAALEAK